jgi:hypothetical protein
MRWQSRIWSSVVAAALVAGWLSSPVFAQSKSDPTGTWTWSVTTQNGQTIESTLKLKMEGEKLTGVYIGRGNQETPIENAQYKNGELSFQVTRERDGNKFAMKFTGKISGDTLKGSTETDFGGQNRTREFEAKRAASSNPAPAAATPAADLLTSLKKGSPDLKSAGALTFGPQGILFVGDSTGAAVFAFDTGDRTPSSSAGAFKIEGIGEKIASMLGTTSQNMLINDLATNPISGKAYIAVSRGKGPEATPVVVRADRSGKIEALSLADIGFAKAPLPNPPDPSAQERGQNLRGEAITDLAYVDGKLLVAGLSNEEFSSRLLAIPFPFSETGQGASIEIFHGSHGRFETKSPVRTFVPFKVGGEQQILAAYTCTPLVKFPVSDLKPGTHVKGTTVAELGNRNRPLDMIVYQKSGKDFLLLANNARGIMKISTDGLDKAEAITSPVADVKGQKYETIGDLKGIVQLDVLDKDNALVLVQTGEGAFNLESIPLP